MAKQRIGMYVATQSFKSSDGKTHRMGDMIGYDVYDSLSSKDKAKCTFKEEEINDIIDYSDDDLEYYDM